MDPNFTSTPRWSTSSFGAVPSTSPMELAALGTHLHHGNGARGPTFPLRCAAQAIDRWVAPRLLTTSVVVAMLIGVGSLLL